MGVVKNNHVHNQESSDSHTTDVLVTERAQDGSRMTFKHLCLSPKVLLGLHDSGFKYPSPVQLRALPLARFGADVIIQAKSGTGKTLVFAIVVLEHLEASMSMPLILTPTREIATQVCSVIDMIGSKIDNLSTHAFIGGLPLHQDIDTIRSKLPSEKFVVVGSPGRIRQLIERTVLDASAIRLLVLDEADKLFSDEFWTVMNFIVTSLPVRKQILSVSATFSEQVRERLHLFMRTPHFIQITDSVSGHQSNERPSELQHAVAVLKGVSHTVINVDEYGTVSPTDTHQSAFQKKTIFLTEVLERVEFQQCIIFFNQRSRADALKQLIGEMGFVTEFIAGDMPQSKRNLVIQGMRQLSIKVLVSTDLTARGLDLPNVKLVICLDVPFNSSTLMHRMGRTGRFGTKGRVVSILSPAECVKLEGMCAKTGVDLISQVDGLLENGLTETLQEAQHTHLAHHTWDFTKSVEETFVKHQDAPRRDNIERGLIDESVEVTANDVSTQLLEPSCMYTERKNIGSLRQVTNLIAPTSPPCSENSDANQFEARIRQQDKTIVKKTEIEGKYSVQSRNNSAVASPIQNGQREAAVTTDSLGAPQVTTSGVADGKDTESTAVREAHIHLRGALEDKSVSSVKAQNRYDRWLSRCHKLDPVVYSSSSASEFKEAMEVSHATWSVVKSKRAERNRARALKQSAAAPSIDTLHSAQSYVSWLLAKENTTETPSRPWLGNSK